MSAETANSFLTWAPPGIDQTVHIDYDVVERLNTEVMRGFGVTRRRGTETGGILLGRVDRRTTPMVVHIHDFEVVPCEYAYGPSYNLSPNDMARFRDALARWQPSLDAELHAVGYFRSQTREGFALDDKDAALFREFFPDASAVALLVKPFATRAATAGIFLQKDGALVTRSTPLEFPFVVPAKVEERRSVEAQPSAAASSAAKHATSSVAALKSEPAKTTPAPPTAARVYSDDRPIFSAHHPEAAPNWRTKLTWGLFGLALLAFGAACGYEYAATKIEAKQVRAGVGAGPNSGPVLPNVDQYTVGLQVQEGNGAVLVKWDRNAAPIQAALHGVLTVTAAAGSKDVRLGFAELRNGMAMYPQTAPQLRFRFEVFFRDNRSFVETAEFRPNANPSGR